MLCTNGAPSLRTSAKMNALEMTHPARMTSAPGAVQQARRDLHHLAGNERHDDLQKLKSQQYEEPHGTRAAHVVDDAVEAARLEQLVEVRP